MSPATLKNAQQYDLHAEAWEAAMPTNVGHKHLEKPAVESLLPDTLAGQDVLCIGVGSGEELTALLARHPRHITALDISSALLKLAAARHPHPTITYQQMDMSALNLPDSSYDLVYSSLVLHYADDWDPVLAQIHRVLRPGGTLLFSTHHPTYWARKSPTGNTFTNARQVTLTEHTALLPGDVTATYYNHPDTASIREALTHARFKITHCAPATMIDTDPALLPDAEREDYMELCQKNANSPLFLIIKATAT